MSGNGHFVTTCDWLFPYPNCLPRALLSPARNGGVWSGCDVCVYLPPASSFSSCVLWLPTHGIGMYSVPGLMSWRSRGCCEGFWEVKPMLVYARGSLYRTSSAWVCMRYDTSALAMRIIPQEYRCTRGSTESKWTLSTFLVFGI